METSVTTPLVCIIDDGIGMMVHIRDYLEFSGFAVETADNGKDGLDIIRERNPEVVMVDMRMPGMDGIEVLTAARGNGYAGHMIVATGLSDDAEKQKCFDAGANDFLIKPYNMAALVELLQAHLEAS